MGIEGADKIYKGTFDGFKKVSDNNGYQILGLIQKAKTP